MSDILITFNHLRILIATLNINFSQLLIGLLPQLMPILRRFDSGVRSLLGNVKLDRDFLFDRQLIMADKFLVILNDHGLHNLFRFIARLKHPMN